MKQVFVTGGTRGIGKAICCLFAQNGFDVGFCYEKSEEEAKKLVSELSEYSNVKAFCCDLSNPEKVIELAEKIRAEFSHLSVLINNAGVSSYGLLQDITSEEFDRVFSVNVKSMFLLTGKLTGLMLNQESASIINISSIWGQTGASCEVLYSASKAAVIGFTKALAKELAPSNVVVNCIAPGVVDTEMMSSFSECEKASLREEIPLGRFAQAHEVAKLALFLAENNNSFITGQVFGINGGQYI